MSVKFHGSFKALRAWLRMQQIVGTWAEEPNGVRMFRWEGGANLHWASTTKRMWIDGKTEARLALERRLDAAMLQNDDRERHGMQLGSGGLGRALVALD